MEKVLNNKIKLYIVSFLTLSLTNLASSQIFNEGVSGEPILQLISPVFLWNIASWIDVGLFAATWGALHFLTKPLLLEVYGFLLDNFPTSNRRNRYSTTSEGEIKGIRAASILTGFLTAQVVGMYIGVFGLIAIPIIGAAAAILGMAFGGKNIISEIFSGDDETATDGGATSSQGGRDNSGSGSTSLPEDAEERMSEMSETINDLQSELNQVQSETSAIESELEDVISDVNSLEAALDRIPEKVKNGELTEKQANQIKQIIKEAESIAQLEEDIEDNQIKIEANTEDIENLEETVEILEERIEELEAISLEEIRKVQEDLSVLNDEKDKLEQRIVELEQKEELGAIDKGVFNEKYSKLKSKLEEKNEQISEVKSELEKAKEDREELRELIKMLFPKITALEQRTNKNEENINQLVNEENKTEQVESKEESDINEFDIPGDWDDNLVSFLQEEEAVLEDEEHETEDLSQVIDHEKWLLGKEEEEANREEETAKSIDAQLSKSISYTRYLENEFQTLRNRLVKDRDTEIIELQTEEKGIREIVSKLREINQGNTQMSITEEEDYTQKAINKLEDLEEKTNDRQQLNEIEEGLNIAGTILDRNDEKRKTVQTHQEASSRDSNTRVFPSPRKNIEKEVSEVAKKARIFLNPDTTRSIQQTEGFIHKRIRSDLQSIEDLKQQEDRPDKIEQYDNLERELIEIANRICEFRSIDKSQFEFL